MGKLAASAVWPPTLGLGLGLALGLALVGCAADKEPVEEPNIVPTDYKQEILSTLKRTLDDPTNVHDAFISDPALTPIGNNQRYIVCLRYNPRDLNRTYMGNTVRIGYFYGGHLNQLVEDSKGECAKAAYKPFPELEKLCYAAKCN